MKYAIVQKTFDVPTPEQLTKAFSTSLAMTPRDSIVLGRHAFGILVGALEWNDADNIARSLNAQGVPVECVDERRLPALPVPKRIQRMDCLPTGLVIHNHLGQQDVLDWHEVTVIAAGSVERMEYKRIVNGRPAYDQGMAGPLPRIDTLYRENPKSHLTLELLAGQDRPRYRIVSHEFSYSYLQERMQNDHHEDFLLLINDLLTFATGAMVNRGAQGLRLNPPIIVDYPKRIWFDRETTWMLWRQSQQ